MGDRKENEVVAAGRFKGQCSLAIRMYTTIHRLLTHTHTHTDTCTQTHTEVRLLAHVHVKLPAQMCAHLTCPYHYAQVSILASLSCLRARLSLRLLSSPVSCRPVEFPFLPFSIRTSPIPQLPHPFTPSPSLSFSRLKVTAAQSCH